MTTEIIELSYETDFGTKGEDSDPETPLSRALDRLFQDGQPFKRLNLCCFQDDEPKWFGVCIKSAADRILFFPGLVKTVQPIVGFKGKDLRWNTIFNIDHMTLEKNCKTWHISSAKSTAHMGKLPTAALGEGRFLWFGMSLSRMDTLRTLKNKTIITSKLPASDSSRRTQTFFDSRDGANFHILEMHPDSRNIFQKGFIHFPVIVGPSGFELYRGEKQGYPIDSPFMSKPLPTGEVQIPIRMHKVSLSNMVDIQINTAWLPGELKTPITLTAIT